MSKVIELPASVEAQIKEIEAREYHIYGEGTGLLCRKICRFMAERVEKEGGKLLTAVQAREAIAAALREYCEQVGMDPEIEVGERDKSVKGYVGEGHEYVSLEAGPYEWAIPASFLVAEFMHSFAEPHFSFDLCLYDE